MLNVVLLAKFVYVFVILYDNSAPEVVHLCRLKNN